MLYYAGMRIHHIPRLSTISFVSCVPLLLILAFAFPALSGCSLQDRLAREIFLSSAKYTDREDFASESFTQHSQRVFSFRYLFYRSLIVRSDEGLIIVDPMNARLSAKLRPLLAQRFPGQAVHTIFYSHYHRDHVEGGRLLEPRNVVAHRNCAGYWRDFGEPEEFAPPTERISGDREYEIGGVRLRLIDLGRSHTDTLYAFVLPDEKILYAPDVGFARSWPTPGPFHTYYPGYIRAMERLAAEGA
ncbi:MAG: MBL fold metallo-hydrolase, partial [Leptospirales bacterium]